MAGEKTVYILGAGVSHTLGAPLMNEFVDRIININEVEFDGADFEPFGDQTLMRNLRRYLSEWKEYIESKNNKKNLNIEELLNLTHISEIIDFHPADKTGLANPTEALNLGINKVIINSLHGKRIDIFEKFTAPLDPKTDSIISFNYDILVEEALKVTQGKFNYCLPKEDTVLEWKRTNVSSGLQVLKLHGSMNWVKCKKLLKQKNCNRLYVYDRKVDNLWPFLNLCRCGGRGMPIIVPVTWNKTIYPELAPIWKVAFTNIRKADRLIVIGYSLPYEDQYFRSMLKLALLKKKKSKLIIINPDKKIIEKFDYLNIDKLNYYSAKFEDFAKEPTRFW